MPVPQKWYGGHDKIKWRVMKRMQTKINTKMLLNVSGLLDSFNQTRLHGHSTFMVQGLQCVSLVINKALNQTKKRVHSSSRRRPLSFLHVRRLTFTQIAHTRGRPRKQRTSSDYTAWFTCEEVLLRGHGSIKTLSTSVFQNKQCSFHYGHKVSLTSFQTKLSSPTRCGVCCIWEPRGKKHLSI